MKKKHGLTCHCIPGKLTRFSGYFDKDSLLILVEIPCGNVPRIEIQWALSWLTIFCREAIVSRAAGDIFPSKGEVEWRAYSFIKSTYPIYT